MDLVSQAQVREAFNLFERNGVIEAGDVALALRSLGFSLPKGFDSRRRQPVSFSEFQNLIQEKQAQSESPDEVYRAFKIFDRRGVGRINLQDLQEIAHLVGDCSVKNLQTILDEVAESPQQGITFDEWCAVMQHLSGQSWALKYDASPSDAPTLGGVNSRLNPGFERKAYHLF
eukprot:NODE_5981_length_665_cov_34.092937_g5958_i0.p1 GENE.NODE_5981_length_665_cov_34.092937_g5958_i0~~NODE_5981_length_665_cov_34.092937_g5958_i0.p1  ORF type:complete len:200 (+),score=11.68 NODE_5981_length_665_cov_34.092937_g5958_i0:83-601(+)